MLLEEQDLTRETFLMIREWLVYHIINKKTIAVETVFYIYAYIFYMQHSRNTGMKDRKLEQRMESCPWRIRR